VKSASLEVEKQMVQAFATEAIGKIERNPPHRLLRSLCSALSAEIAAPF
jgi:hypothetical protein